MSYADVPIKLRTLSRALQISLSKQGIDMDIRDALNAVVDLPALGILDPCNEGCLDGCKEACKSGCKDSQREG